MYCFELLHDLNDSQNTFDLLATLNKVYNSLFKVSTFKSAPLTGRGTIIKKIKIGKLTGLPESMKNRQRASF